MARPKKVIASETLNVGIGPYNRSAQEEETKVYANQCTAFVSNLNVKANNEHLRQFFSDVGGVVAIRILKDKFTGKSRGLAYADFSDDAHLAAAVAKNNQTLLDKKLSIARSDPKSGKKEHGHTDQTGAVRGSHETSNEPGESRGSDSAIKGKNTFAVPRNVAHLVGARISQKLRIRMMKSQNLMMSSEACS
ncbi:heterogeneous nuclear ribonucleoprotein 87F-like [Rosa chinensis]|uniref:heterogeneous nuclear ribonucleoprotein 87F-like n=1 Tax=Rosa chinensis TaxID=74649 RepID=UPI000D090C06|nr:heterogeneous nuclear ribonucleoprotein 87F-like [Rosa chinensis]